MAACLSRSRRLRTAAAEFKGIPTYNFQDHLPSLPVPPLEQTLNRYVEWSKPVLSEIEHASLVKAVQEFRTSGLGERLQLALLDHRREAGKNWLEPFWDDMYLGDRGPQPLAVHYHFVLDALPASIVAQGPPAIAAAIIESMIAFREKLASHTYPPNVTGETPLCMHQFTHLFGGTRIPAPGRDQWISYDTRTRSTSLAATADAPRHIVVVRLGRSFVVPIYGPDGAARPTAHIHADLRAIHCAAPALHCGPSVFQAGGREEAAVARAALLEQGNDAVVAAVDSALAVIVLDEERDASDTAAAWTAYAGGPRSRWYDKALQIIVSDSGRVSTAQEHAAMDGHTVVQLLATLVSDITDKYGRVGCLVPVVSDGAAFDVAAPAAIANATTPAAPERGELVFVMNEQLAAAAAAAEAAFIARRRGHCLAVMDFPLGAADAKRARVSPDYATQLLFQGAYVATHGRAAQTYESCLTKRFHHGRTETLRPVSPQMVAACNALLDSATTTTNVALLDIIRSGSDEHRLRSKICTDGQGVDRHLLGLKLMFERHAAELGVTTPPSIFYKGADGINSYATYKTDLLSTSALSVRGVMGFAFAPTSDAGLGMGYSTRGNAIVGPVTCLLPSVSCWGILWASVLV